MNTSNRYQAYVQQILEREQQEGWVYVPPPTRSLGKKRLKLLGSLFGIVLGIVALIGHFRTATPHTSSPKGNPEAHVWVDRQFGLYYCSGVYKRLGAEEMTQAEAKQKRLRPALGPCR